MNSESSPIDATTLRELWDLHADRLLLIARSIAGGSIGAMAEDAVQEAFVALATQKRLPEDPLAWLVRVTRNRLLGWHRSGQRRRGRETTVAQATWFDTPVRTAEQQLEVREITDALRSLPSPEREIIVMHLWGELTFESISKIVGGSRAKTHRAFHRGLETLQRKFNPGDLAATADAKHSSHV